jgi:hypothetical protein
MYELKVYNMQIKNINTTKVTSKYILKLPGNTYSLRPELDGPPAAQPDIAAGPLGGHLIRAGGSIKLTSTHSRKSYHHI